MSYIPSDANWFIAEILVEITVEGDPRNVVHKNFILIEASSAEDAYEKSLACGQKEDISYLNPQGKKVQMKFRGIAQLDVIGSELRHGTEILFIEKIGMSEGEILRCIPTKDCLSAFLPVQPGTGPNYAAGDIVRETERMIENKRTEQKEGR